MRILFFIFMLFIALSGTAFSSNFLCPTAADRSDYTKDFEFIEKTVARSYPCLKSKKIDWKRACAKMRPMFMKCESDAEHVKNVMRLLAVLKDSHSGVIRTSIDWKLLPSKFDGLYGGGLWMGWDNGFIILRGMMQDHHMKGSIPAGSALAAINSEPAWLAIAREKKRITPFMGSSSDHSLFASMSNRFFQFGNEQKIDLLFLMPDAKTRNVSLSRWGPGGKAFSPSSATLPEGVEWAKGAVSAFIKSPWCGKLGYLRITGSMNSSDANLFHTALDRLKGMEALLLDCKGMGGGGDGPAWDIAGRFFENGVNNGINGRIEASGSWRFSGPVVMLQDELEVSSAETFTWAMSETERVVSVGRNTGGWAIIPKVFKCPSGLVDFRMGVTDRQTPIERVRTEGVGWPPDVLIPYGPVFCGMKDPVMEVGLQVLRVLHAGVPQKKAVDAFNSLFSGQVKKFKKEAPKLSKELKGWKPEQLSRHVEDDIEGRIEMEIALLELDEAGPCDALGAGARLDELARLAKAAGIKGLLSRLEKTVKKLGKEAAAQEAFIEITGPGFESDEASRKDFFKQHGKTKTGRYIKEHLWK